MGLVAKNYTFSAGATIVAAEHNSNFDTLYTVVNGNLNTNNLLSSAGIVDTQLAQITTTGKVNLSAVQATSQATGDMVYASSATVLARLAGNTAATKKFLNQTGNGSASAAPSWDAFSAADIPAGGVVKVGYAQTVEASTHNTAFTPIAGSDTAPTNADGGEISNLNLVYTALSATNYLLFDICINWSAAAGQNTDFGLSLLDGTTVIAVFSCVNINNGTMNQFHGQYKYTPGDVNEHTYSLRIGSAAGDTVTINGEAGSRILGNVHVSSIKALEIKA